MKIAVIGAGALGCVFGGLLAADGNDVWLLHHRESAAREIDDRGVVLVEPDGEERRVDVRATVDASRVGPADLALVLVKAPQTIPAVEQHAAAIGPATRVLSLQNGVTNHDRLREHVGADRSLHGVTYQGAIGEGSGRVKRTNPGPSLFGGEDAAFVGRVAETFESAGIEVETVPDPSVPIWRKQLTGAAIKPVAALTRLPNRTIVADEGLADLMGGLMEETASVAETRGVDLGDVDGTLADLREVMAGTDHTSSMLQDVQARRQTEIEDVNGATVEIGQEAGVAVPLNETVTALVRGVEQGLDLDG